MRICQETPADYPAVYNLVKTAFETARVSNGQEQDFVVRLRGSGGYIPELAFIAWEGETPAGYILLTRLRLTGKRAVKGLLLAPLAVRLENRGKGVGSLLVKTALERSCRLGYEAVFLVGNPGYYNRFGFARLDSFGGICNRQIPAAYALACELVPGILAGAGVQVNFLG